MLTHECERRLTLRIQAGGRDHDMCLKTCDKKDVEDPPTVLCWLNTICCKSGGVFTNGTCLVPRSEVSMLALLYAIGSTYTCT